MMLEERRIFLGVTPLSIIRFVVSAVHTGISEEFPSPPEKKLVAKPFQKAFGKDGLKESR
jgi:hypothetical protein